MISIKLEKGYWMLRLEKWQLFLAVQAAILEYTDKYLLLGAEFSSFISVSGIRLFCHYLQVLS